MNDIRQHPFIVAVHEMDQRPVRTNPLLILSELCPDVSFDKPNDGWTATPTFLSFVIKYIVAHSPETILEVGSGLSTLAIASCLKKTGRKSFLSLEHDARYARSTQQKLVKLRLESFASVCHAPLRRFQINNSDVLWYDYEKHLSSIEKIDLLVVDGPPYYVQPAGPLSRLAATPFQVDERLHFDSRRWFASWRTTGS
jgi:predicted O-methyltransferase YrrM